jgi:hypothetical protein
MSARRKTTKRKPEEYASHLIRVRTWELYFWRHATDPKSKWETGEFSEIATLTFAGDVVRPEKTRFKTGKITFSGRADRPAPIERSPEAVPIGSATAHDEEIEAYIFIPDERLRLFLLAAQSNRVEVAHFAGTKIRYGRGTVLSVSIGTHFDENDW